MMDINEIVGIARKARPLMSRTELVWLCELAQRAPDGAGIEVGVYCGASLIAWSLIRAGRGTAIGVDNWAYRDPNPNNPPINDLEAVCARNLLAAGATAHLIDGDSIAVADHMPDDLAFVFIDGEHTSPSIDNDILHWTPKLMHGGIVVFHDYGQGLWPDVKAAVDRWAAQVRWPLVGRVETTVGYRKP